jgi:hypothetical protein
MITKVHGEDLPERYLAKVMLLIASMISCFVNGTASGSAIAASRGQWIEGERSRTYYPACIQLLVYNMQRSVLPCIITENRIC